MECDVVSMNSTLTNKTENVRMQDFTVQQSQNVEFEGTITRELNMGTIRRDLGQRIAEEEELEEEKWANTGKIEQIQQMSGRQS